MATAVLAGCESGGSNASLDKESSRFEGYSVTNCRSDPSVDQIGREVGDVGAKAYDCSDGLGVVIEPNGQMSDFDASSDEQQSSLLTAAEIAAKIIAIVTKKTAPDSNESIVGRTARSRAAPF